MKIRRLEGPPPGGEHEILKLMVNLEEYMNEDLDGIDPLIKLTVIHYQFDSIHPFYELVIHSAHDGY